MIFGCTIYEAQQRVDIKELELWLSYRKRYGSLSFMHNSMYYQALHIMTFINSNKTKDYVKLDDILPKGFFGGEAEEEAELDTPEKVQNFARALHAAFSSSARPKERKSRLFRMRKKESDNGD